MKSSVLAAMVAVLLTGPAMAGGLIETSCLRGGRPTADRTLCGCLQRVADAVLPQADQRRGAGFFSEPDKSQEAMMSGSAADKAFWARWELFAATAVKHCQ